MVQSCDCCAIADRLAAQGQLHPMGPSWTVNARIGHVRPALVVQTKVHRPSIEDLSADELRTLGPVLAAASAAVEEHGNVERVYVNLYGEGRPGHVHFHVVPRFTSDSPEHIGPRLPDVPPEGGHLDSHAAAAAAGQAIPAERAEPSTYVRAVRGLCRWWHNRVSAYRVIQRLTGRQSAVDAGELYVTLWLGAWAAVFGMAALIEDQLESDVAFWAIAAITGYRMVDISLYEVQILLTMEPSPLRSVPRALLLRVGNLGEIALAAAALLVLRVGMPASAAVLAGFRTVTLQGEFGYPGQMADLIVVAATATSLLLLVGGVAMLLGKVSESFHEA